MKVSYILLQNIMFGYESLKMLKMPARDRITLLNVRNKAEREYANYEKLRLELCMRHANKNDDGTPVMVDGNFDIHDKDAFNEEFRDLASQMVDFGEVSISTKISQDTMIDAPGIELLTMLSIGDIFE